MIIYCILISPMIIVKAIYSCLQETKTTERDEMLLQGGYALTLMEQKAGRQYGMDFVVSPRLNGNVKLMKLR